jgi:DNA-binding NarL/FixJ family response regulator
MTIRVAIVEDHPIVVRAIERELSVDDEIVVVGSANRGSDLMALVAETSPDVVVLDLGMSKEKFEPAPAVENLRRRHPHVQVLVLTGHEEPTTIRQLVDAGALGYVVKGETPPHQLPDVVRTVHSGRRFYSPTAAANLSTMQDVCDLNDREIVVLRLAADGLANEAIAQEIGSSRCSVANCLTTIYRKLDIVDESINPRVAAVNKARELGCCCQSDHGSQTVALRS